VESNRKKSEKDDEVEELLIELFGAPVFVERAIE